MNPTSSKWLISSLMILFRSRENLLCHCWYAGKFGSVFSLWKAIPELIPGMSLCVHANTSWFCLKNSISWACSISFWRVPTIIFWFPLCRGTLLGVALWLDLPKLFLAPSPLVGPQLIVMPAPPHIGETSSWLPWNIVSWKAFDLLEPTQPASYPSCATSLDLAWHCNGLSTMTKHTSIVFPAVVTENVTSM